MQPWPFRLRELGLAFRAGLSFLVLTLLGGLVASAGHLVGHHEKRDEQAGLSMEDLRGAYHGVRVVAPMLAALERGHPEGLAASEREILLGWLRGARISEDYDSLDLGELSPAEVIDRACLSCHARQAAQGEGLGQSLPLEYWDDVAKLAFSREVSAVAPEILLASAHTHALAMGVLSIVAGLLACFTRWPARAVGALFLLSGLGLFVDLAAWFLARSSAAVVPLLAAAGATWLGTSAILLLLVLADVWLPQRAREE